MALIIVESPTKAKTISQFLGKQHSVESSYGHIRDLPRSKLGIDVEKNFEPQYIIPRKNQKHVTKLKKLAAKASAVILATDEDREGEAIAYHLMHALGLDGEQAQKTSRIVFHEITESAIREALEHPRALDAHLVNAQQARRVLDRLVGYKLSPFLWKKVVRGLSAGRVQSVALRLIADREEEIKRFVPEEYWTIAATFSQEKDRFDADLLEIDGVPLEKMSVQNKADAERMSSDIEKAAYRITDIEKKKAQKHPLPPFITSTLQQESTKRLGFSAKKTMFLAQNLYENGHITYMRTDSVNLSKEALSGASQWISENLPREYLLAEPRVFKTKSRLAQEAHEAIRPTRPEADMKSLALEKDQARIYDLVWKRFIASQLPSAVFDASRITVEGTSGAKYLFGANGTMMQFDGFLRIWPAKFEEKQLPHLKEGAVTLDRVAPSQHFTEPPPRYNEASIIKTLEKYGIGRPSTYAPIISVIQERNYVEKQQGRFYPTEIGTLVNNVLKENFPEIVDIQFTAKMEEELDDVAEGKTEWQAIVKAFYVPFAKHLAEKYESVEKQGVIDEKTDIPCEKCGKLMIIKFGRFGKFLACSGFPECKSTKTLKDPLKSTGVQCEKCLADPARKESPGELIERRVRKGRARGKIFWGCSRYPDCDHATWTNPLAPKQEPAEKTGVEAETETSDDSDG